MGLNGEEICSAGEVLIAAIVVECLIYLFLFIGGWELIRRWKLKKAIAKRMREENNAKWNPMVRLQKPK